MPKHRSSRPSAYDRQPRGLPAIHETSLLHLEDLPTLVPITTSKGSARIDHTESLELSRGEQRPSNSMHPTAYVEQLRRHTAHPIETQAVRSILAASVTSSITEPSSSDSETKTGSSLQSQTVQCGVMHHPEKPDASNWGPDRPGYGNKASSAHLSTTVSLDGALSVAWTDVGSKTPAEVEALPGFWDEQSRVMSHLRHRRTLLDSDAAAPIENAPHRTTLSPGFDQTHEEGDQLAGSEEELLHTSSSISNVGRGWSRPKRAPPALVFRKGDMNMLSMAKQPRKLSEWEWVGVETMQALPVEAQEAVRSAQGRQSAILGRSSEATERIYDACEHVDRKEDPYRNGYVHNDQTFYEKYWNDPPPPPATVLWKGPFSYPRTHRHHSKPRECASLDDFLNDPGGGEGTAMLLHARDKAEEVMGYDWLCTVLVAQGRSFPWLPIAVVMVWSVLVCCIMLFVCKTNLMLRETGGEEGLDIKNWQRLVFTYLRGFDVPNSVVGAAVTFLLVFRVNTGYERWWEGRRTFREVVNHSRDIARQCATHISDFYHAEKMIRWVMVSVIMLKQHLREETFVDEVRGIVSDDAVNFLASARNKPYAVAQRLSELMYTAVCSQVLLPDMAPAMDLNISDLTNSIGTCEMILTTPMPFAYVAHLRTFILLWLMQLAPFFCTHCGWATILAMAPVTFLFLGLDSISGEIENPFGYDWNDLPLDGIIAQLMSDLAQVLQVMLDIPVQKNVVSFSDLAKFNVSTFGADAIIRHLTAGGDAATPVLPAESLFMKRFWRAVAQADDDDEEEEGGEDDEEGCDDGPEDEKVKA